STDVEVPPPSLVPVEHTVQAAEDEFDPRTLPPDAFEEATDEDDDPESYELVVEEASAPEAEEVAEALEEEVRQSFVPDLPSEPLQEAPTADSQSYISSFPPAE